MAEGPPIGHPNAESELDVDPRETEERITMDDLVPDGMDDESNIEDPADTPDIEGELRAIEDLPDETTV